jgi:hypothetical protein
MHPNLGPLHYVADETDDDIVAAEETQSPTVTTLVRPGRDDRRFRAPAGMVGAEIVYLSCHYCAYGPAEVPPAGRCPKCGGHSWDRYVRRFPLEVEPQKR